jgi:hypothetical protein
MYVCPSVCLSIHLSVNLSIHPSIDKNFLIYLNCLLSRFRQIWSFEKTSEKENENKKTFQFVQR